MFAVLKTGGKQYKVAKNDIFLVEKLLAEAGETVQFNDVLMLGGETVTVGAPLVAGAAVQAEILEQTRGEKVISFVKRRRKHSSQRKRGHRQHLTRVRITEILASGGEESGVRSASAAPSVAVQDGGLTASAAGAARKIKAPAAAASDASPA